MLKERISNLRVCMQRLRSNAIVSAILSSPAALVFLSTLIIGFLAHGYAFFHASLTFDSLNAFYADVGEQAWKISLGRFIVPVYQTFLRGHFAVPWLIGCLSLVWLGLASYFVVRMFNLKSPVCIILTTGILIANLSVSVTAATFIHDLDVNMFALFMAVLAACRWKQNPRRIDCLSVLCIAVSLGVYQSFVSVCILLMVTQCIFNAFHYEKLADVIIEGVFACLTLLAGAALYAGILWAIFNFSALSVNTSTGNGLQNLEALSFGSLFLRCRKSYSYMHTDLFNYWRNMFSRNFYRIAHGLLVLCSAANAVDFLIHMKKSARKNVVLAALLLILIPPIVYFSVILSNDNSHHLLMLYALWLIYLLILLFVYQQPRKKTGMFAACLRVVVAVTLAIFVWGNVRMSNSMYLLKGMQSDSATSLFTRILYRMEDSDEYITGETPVAIIGETPLLTPHFPGKNADYIWSLFGMTTVFSERKPWYAYDPMYRFMKYNLSNPLILCDDATYLNLAANEEVLAMPDYPKDGCMKLVDGVFIVKLGKPNDVLRRIGK